MATTGDIFAGIGENNAEVGSTAWTNPGNVTADDAADATCNAPSNSQYLVSRGFGFSIPSGATINGVTVKIEASEHSGGTESLTATLQNDSGTLMGAGKLNTISGTAKAVYTYGGTADLWSASITPTIVNDADFGVRLRFSSAHDIRIDYVTIAIEYTDSGNVTMQVSSGSFAITGSNIRMFQSYTLSLQSTSYSITGSNINFTTGFRTELQSGSYLITGSNISFLVSYVMQLQSGSYAINGSNVNFLTGERIQLVSGTYQITGSNIRLLENPNIILQSGSYQITGSNVAFLIGEVLQVESGNFQIVGSNVNMFQSYLLQLQSGNYSISGSNVALLENFYMPVQSGSFQITGSNVNLIESVVIQLQSGNYSITGSDVNFLVQFNVLQTQSGSYFIQGSNVSFIYSQQQQPGGVKCCDYEIKTFSNELETQFGYTGAPGKTPKVDVFYNIDGMWYSAGVFTSIIIEFVEALSPDNYSYNIKINHGGVATGVVKIW